MKVEITTKFKIHKPANEVFEAIADPYKMANYWFSSGTGRIEQGKKITWRYDEYNAEVLITVLEVEEGKKIVFSWGEEGLETTVTITLSTLEEASTEIGITESGFKEDDPDLVEKLVGQKGGWVYMLSCLKGYLENDINTLRASLIH